MATSGSLPQHGEAAFTGVGPICIALAGDGPDRSPPCRGHGLRFEDGWHLAHLRTLPNSNEGDNLRSLRRSRGAPAAAVFALLTRDGAAAGAMHVGQHAVKAPVGGTLLCPSHSMLMRSSRPCFQRAVCERALAAPGAGSRGAPGLVPRGPHGAVDDGVERR